MMSINAISSAMSASVYLRDVNKLTEDVIEKLNNIGIDPNSVSSVSEANQLIKKAEESSQSESKQNQNSDENAELRKKAVDLAKEIGVKVSDNDTLDDILANISKVIEKMLDYAIEKNDKALYDKFADYKRDLDDIEADNNGGGFSNLKIFSFMDMIAEQNKYVHGIKQ